MYICMTRSKKINLYLYAYDSDSIDIRVLGCWLGLLAGAADPRRLDLSFMFCFVRCLSLMSSLVSSKVRQPAKNIGSADTASEVSLLLCHEKKAFHPRFYFRFLYILCKIMLNE